MRDPRLVEIDFLMELDQKVQLALMIHNGDQTQRYGTDSGRFRDMVLELLSQGYLAGMKLRTYGSDVDERALSAERNILMAQLTNRQEIKVWITHSGRVHLWNLKDALLKNPDIEPFGLRSRAAWERDLFIRLRWATGDSPLSVMFIDLDNFGNVNKKHGAPVGDAVLRVVFSLISNTVGSRGATYRYGGEEIGVLLPGVPLEQAATMAEQLRRLIEENTHAQVSKLDAPQTASIGVDAFEHPIENDMAVGRVDNLMRAAKQAGRNQVKVALVSSWIKIPRILKS